MPGKGVKCPQHRRALWVSPACTQLIRKWSYLWGIWSFCVFAVWLEQMLVCNAVLAFLLRAPLSSLISPKGLEAIKPTSKLKIASKFSRGTPRQLEFHFSSCFAIQADSIQAVQALASAKLPFASFRSLCKPCRLQVTATFGFEGLWNLGWPSCGFKAN